MTSRTDRTPAHSARYLQALQLAADRHLTQRRKGTTVPYLSHLLAVSAMVWDDGGTEDEAIGALLHDIVEDTDLGHDGVLERFGDVVGGIVRACTDAASAPGEQKAPWRPRKLAHHRELARARPEVLRVVCADKVSNAEAQLADHLAAADDRERAACWARFKGGWAGTLWYLQGMRAAVGDRLPESRLPGRLDSAIAALAALWLPDRGQEERIGRLADGLRELDPGGVGPDGAGFAGADFYRVDATELVRRLDTAGSAGPAVDRGALAAGLLGPWYVALPAAARRDGREVCWLDEVDLSWVDAVLAAA